MNYPDKLYYLRKRDFKIYPLIRLDNGTNKFAVCVEDPNNFVYQKPKTVGEYKHTSKSLNSAIEQTVNHIYEKLTECQ